MPAKMPSTRDNCESIGGEREMTRPCLTPEEQARISGIVVREFEGIDHLPDSLADLIAIATKKRRSNSG